MALLDDVAGYLVAQSTAFSLLSGSGGNLGKAVMLDKIAQSTVTVVYETGGFANQFAFSTSTGAPTRVVERPAFQLIHRSTSYPTARSRAETAYNLFDGLTNINMPTATGTNYIEVTADQPPFSLGRDENDRYLIVTNFSVMR